MRILHGVVALVAAGVLLVTSGCTADDGSSQAGRAAPAASASAADAKQPGRQYLVSDKTSGKCSTSEDDGLITAADVNAVVGHDTKYYIYTCLVINYTQQNFVFKDGKSYPSINVGSVKGQGAVAAWENLKKTTPHEIELSYRSADGTPIDQFRAPGFALAICTNCDDPAKAVFVVLFCTDLREGDYAKDDDGYLLRLGKVALDNMLAHY